MLTLPPELLVEIFVLVLSGWKQSFWELHMAESHVRESFITAVDLSRVCKLFRTVALSAPILWNHVDMSRDVPAWIVSAMLERSSQASLRVEVNSMTDARILERESHRIKALVYYRRDERERDTYCMPMLQELYIDCESRSRSRQVPFVSSEFLLPRLRRLSLIGVHPRHASPFLLPALTHFRFYLYDPIPPLAVLIRALGNMPLLEKLVLGFDSDSVHWSSEGVQEVTLPRLRGLEVHQSHTACAILLRYLKFPASTFLSGGFTFFDDEMSRPAVMSAILSKLSGHGLLGPRPDIDELVITGASVCDSLRLGSTIEALKDETSVYSSSCDVRGASLPINEALRCLCNVPHLRFLSRIRHLTLQTPDNTINEIPEFPSTRLTLRLRNLRYLHLKYAPTLWYGLTRLHYRLAADPIPHTAPMPFPKLRYLDISNAPFRSKPPCIGTVDLGDEDFIFQLRDMLKIRRDAGVPLRSLCIWDPIDFNGEEDAQILKAYVEDVVEFGQTSPEPSTPGEYSDFEPT
ncbi:hypothetical protein EIP91_009990 [Steccherinum ochraceum]|uniref:Uncharacterized protein n=1 Tax=Steccherinum ochraceum TaxID=92696 RepID=A0A4R0RM82_9APHY|nr:hypothetical protein EIP91_009990 [Steccherinum ochraceum]